MATQIWRHGGMLRDKASRVAVDGLGILGQCEVNGPGAPIEGLASTRPMGCRVGMPGGVPNPPGDRLCVCLESTKRETVLLCGHL